MEIWCICYSCWRWYYSWSAETTIASTDADGVVDFSISFTDLASNDGGIVTSPTAGNPDVTVDNTAPTLTAVSIVSDNADPSRATTDDTVTLSFTSLEPIETPAVTFGGVTTTVTGSNDTLGVPQKQSQQLMLMAVL